MNACIASWHIDTVPYVSGIDSPSIGNFNTISTRARVHHTVRVSSFCVIGAGCLVAPTDDEILDEYTVIYGPAGERRVWSGRGRIQEAENFAFGGHKPTFDRYRRKQSSSTHRCLLIIRYRLHDVCGAVRCMEAGRQYV